MGGGFSSYHDPDGFSYVEDEFAGSGGGRKGFLHSRMPEPPAQPMPPPAPKRKVAPIRRRQGARSAKYGLLSARRRRRRKNKAKTPTNTEVLAPSTPTAPSPATRAGAGPAGPPRAREGSRGSKDIGGNRNRIVKLAAACAAAALFFMVLTRRRLRAAR